MTGLVIQAGFGTPSRGDHLIQCQIHQLSWLFWSSFFFQPLLNWLAKQIRAAPLQQISGGELKELGVTPCFWPWATTGSSPSIQSGFYRAKASSWSFHTGLNNNTEEGDNKKLRRLGKTTKQNGWRSCPGLRLLQPNHIHIHSEQHSSYARLLHITQRVWNPWHLHTTGARWLVIISDLVCASPLSF